MGLLEEIALRLSSQGVGTTNAGSTGWLLSAWDFSGPSTANDWQIAIVPTGGFGAEVSEGTTHLTRPTFQTLVRGGTPGGRSSTGLWAKVEALITALELYQGTLSGHKYLDIQLQGEPSFIGRDANQRPIVSVNWLALRSRTT